MSSADPPFSPYSRTLIACLELSVLYALFAHTSLPFPTLGAPHHPIPYALMLLLAQTIGSHHRTGGTHKELIDGR